MVFWMRQYVLYLYKIFTHIWVHELSCHIFFYQMSSSKGVLLLSQLFGWGTCMYRACVRLYKWLQCTGVTYDVWPRCRCIKILSQCMWYYAVYFNHTSYWKYYKRMCSMWQQSVICRAHSTMYSVIVKKEMGLMPWVAHLPCNQSVVSSSPVNTPVVSLRHFILIA